MTIRVLSFDFDGCLFNTAYSNAPYTNFDKHLTDAVLIHNEKFLEQLRHENERFSQVIAMIGSNRQSFAIDILNRGFLQSFKGSCCSAIQTVCNYLHVDFNPLLLADLYNSLEPGTAYQLIMDEIKSGKWIDGGALEHKECPVDQFKVPLIFAQMQEAAAKNPDEQIIFDFYDDRHDILASLQEFYSSHPHTIPKNVLLRLNHYDGAEPTLKEVLVGEGTVLNNYPEIVVNMLDNLWKHNDIAMEIKSNRNKPEMLQPVMQSAQFDSSDAVEEGELESDCGQNQSVDLVGAAQVEEQSEKEAVEITAAPAAAGKAPGATVASAASNLGRNRHSFHNQAARSTTHGGPAPIPAEYFEDSCGFNS
ncbi:hypothetical protein OQJ26_15780 [Legionella sp. PATHC038]|uniref:hypothetical protein n=1 Tax=Legionella sheltonii TaxID=2992041 RepID=UPI002244BF7A|nr:hypothetical protein [Legionella sp. PATHC038]MCW8400245.1 hypothetical protein [Legionella sp. PATHC038]